MFYKFHVEGAIVVIYAFPVFIIKIFFVIKVVSTFYYKIHFCYYKFLEAYISMTFLFFQICLYFNCQLKKQTNMSQSYFIFLTLQA